MDTCCLILPSITFEEGHIKLFNDLLHSNTPHYFNYETLNEWAWMLGILQHIE
jgi:hypothetical protein